MRACIVLFALLATPLVVGVSQIPPELPGNSSCDNGQGDETRSDSGTMHAHQGLCVPQSPPPPPTCGQAPAGGGTATITGQVFQDVAPDFPGLENWCVDLTGPVSGSMVTDPSGNYSFSRLPAGTYLVCLEVQTGWHETRPSNGASCPGGLGYSFSLADGDMAGMNDFGVVTP